MNSVLTANRCHQKGTSHVRQAVWPFALSRGPRPAAERKYRAAIVLTRTSAGSFVDTANVASPRQRRASRNKSGYLPDQGSFGLRAEPDPGLANPAKRFATLSRASTPRPRPPQIRHQLRMLTVRTVAIRRTSYYFRSATRVGNEGQRRVHSAALQIASPRGSSCPKRKSLVGRSKNRSHGSRPSTLAGEPCETSCAEVENQPAGAS